MSEEAVVQESLVNEDLPIALRGRAELSIVVGAVQLTCLCDTLEL